MHLWQGGGFFSYFGGFRVSRNRYVICLSLCPMMTFPRRGGAGAGPEGVFAGELDREAICRMLCHDWQRLYPLRHSHGARIRRVLAQGCPGAGVEARAAFGVGGCAPAPGWLYRDFYVRAPPARAGVDRAIGRLRRGEAGEVLAALEAPDLSDAGLRRIWYEVSTLSGRLPGLLRAEAPGEAGGRIGNRAEVRARIREALAGPPGIDAHREGLLRTLHAVLGGDMEEAAAAECVGLLIHHTDLAFRQPLRLGRLGPHQAAGLYQALIALQGWLRDPVRFLQLLRAGLCSPSRRRRFLSYRLLRIEGHLGDEHHPDDALSRPELGPHERACS